MRVRFRDFPYNPCPTTTHTVSPIINIPHQNGAFVTIDEPILANHNHPKSIVYIRVHAWCCMFYGFGQTYKDIYPSIIILHGVFSLPLKKKWLYYFVFLPAVTESSCCSACSPPLGFVSVPDFGSSNRCAVASHCCFNLHFPDDI